MATELKHYIIKVKNKDVLDTLISDMMGWNVKVEHVYRKVFYGFAAPLTSLYVKTLKNDPRVDYVEESVEFTNYTQQNDAPWHLDRIDQRVFPLSGSYTYDSDGTGVIVYVLDSGCVYFNPNKLPSDTANFNHIEFGGRVTPVNKLDNSGMPILGLAFDPIYDTLQVLDPENSRLSSPRGFDHFGHGTHVAGIIGSATYGVAKNVDIRPAKVLDVFGSGTLGNVVAGIEAIIADFENNTSGEPAVCNMSLGTSAPANPEPSGSFEIAVQALVNAGVTVVVAAGNSGEDANNTSPARMSSVITVGATARKISDGEVVGDIIATFSNFGDSEDIIADDTFGFAVSTATNIGSAVNIFAPGVSIVSLGNSSPTAVNTFSGTSMASPCVAGVAVLILQNNLTLSPSDVFNVMSVNALDDIIEGIPVGTPNRMLFSTFVDHTIQWLTPAGNLGSFPEGFTLNPQVDLDAVGFSGQQLTYSNPAGGLPPGITVNPVSGILDGIAPVVLSDIIYNFDIRASDSSGFAEQSFNLTVLDGLLPPNWLTSPDLSSVEEGETLNIQLTAESRSNPQTTVVYTPVDNEGNPALMPHGWNLSSTGLINGLVPIVVNNDLLTTFTVRADDGNTFTDREFRILIRQSSFINPPVWQTDFDLGEIVRFEPISIQLLATDADGGPLPVKYKLQVQTGDGTDLGPFSDLPQGLFLDEDTGIISGSFTGEMKDGTVIFPTTFDNNTTTFDNNITTLESSRSVFEFQVFAVDGSFLVGRWFSLLINYLPENIPVEWITAGGSIGSAKALTFKIFNIEARDPDNGPKPIKYTLVSGNLPAGMFLNSSTGEISGVLENISVPEIINIFTIQVSDGQARVNRTFSITVSRVNKQPQWITPPGLLLSALNEGASFAVQLEATDPNEEDILFYSVINNVSNPMLLDNSNTTFDSDTTTFTDQQTTDSNLPPGIVLDSDTGILSGTILNVEANITFEFTVRVDDRNSNAENETLFEDRIFAIEVIDGPLNLNNPPVWITPEGSLPDGTENENYFYELEATDLDGPSPLRFIFVAGGLPKGLALNVNSGIISGLPNDLDLEDTTSIFTVRIFDGVLSTDRTFDIKVIDTTVSNEPPIWITPASNIGSFDELTSMVFALDAFDPEGTNVTFTDSTNSLPTGLSVTQDGIITGITQQVAIDQTFNFTIEASDEDGGVTLQDFSITILDTPNVAPIWITDSSLGTYSEGVFTPLAVVAIDPDTSPLPNLIYVDTSGSATHLLNVPIGATIELPPGLSIDSSGLITGTTSIANDTTFSFEITVNDGAASVPEQFFITIIDTTSIPTDISDLVIKLTGNNRLEFQSWNTSEVVFDDELFGPLSPEFGRNLEPEIYVMNNIHTIDPEFITTAFGVHHKRFETLGGIPAFAVVRDTNDNIIYEVIYVNIIDPQLGSDFDITTTTSVSSLDTNGPETYISRNFAHLRTELQTLPNSEILPAWMSSEQVVGDTDSILGYTPALILAYVNPGLGESIIERLNFIETHIEITPAKPTIFDTHVVFGDIFEPIITISSSLTIKNGDNLEEIVDFPSPPYTLIQIAQEINDENIPGITAVAQLIEMFVPDVPPATWPGEFQTGSVLSITYDQDIVIFGGDALAEIGLPNIGQETGWNDSTTFDNSTGTELIIDKGLGYQFTGRKLSIDRYLFNDNKTNVTRLTSFDSNTTILDGDTTVFDKQLGVIKWIKFSSDTDNPFWITLKGVLGGFNYNDVVSIRLEAGSHVGGTLSYSLIYGSLPEGVTLSSSTGEISGTISNITTFDGDTTTFDSNTTIIDKPFGSNYFVIRVIDDENGLVADRGFDILIGIPTTFDNDLTTFDGNTTTLDVG